MNNMYNGMGYIQQNLPPQQRLAMMEQMMQPQMGGMYPFQPPQQQQMPMAAPTIKGRPVSSVEEARASMIDFDGSMFIFPNPANDEIYTKQINLDGSPNFQVYRRVIDTGGQQVSQNDMIAGFMQNLVNELSAIKERIASIEGGISNDKSNDVNATGGTVKKQSKSRNDAPANGAE